MKTTEAYLLVRIMKLNLKRLWIANPHKYLDKINLVFMPNALKNFLD